MSEPSVRSFHLKQPDGDEVEKSIEFLDKVLSEFEDPDSLPHINPEPETPTQGNQSEDDGYMSMNGKKELKLIDIDGDNQSKCKKSFSEAKIRNEFSNSFENTEITPLQTTLPKTRPLNVNPSKFASLPCSTASKVVTEENETDSFLKNGRIKLGIDISAVHDAVLRGVARIPETIVNEHPVTIYPGRSSPVKKSKSTTISEFISSKHDVTIELLELNIKDDDGRSESEDDEDDDDDEDSNELESHSKDITQSDNQLDDIKPLQQSLSLSNFNHCHNVTRSEEEFSDDSLENANGEQTSTEAESHIPPPVFPEGNECQIMPEKCSPGIAWEIKLNDISPSEKPTKMAINSAIPVPDSIPIPFPFSINSNLFDCENSVASTPCNSILSTDHSFSSDWPDPPENPICSTEDEAGSIFTDSEDVLPLQTTIIPNGTYVIRKGRERKQVFEIPEFAPSLNLSESGAESILDTNQEVLNIEEEINEIVPQSMIQPTMNIPKYRHSIDLALPTSIHSPKHMEYNSFWQKPDDIQIKHANSLTPSKQDYFAKKECDSPNRAKVNDDLNVPLMRVASLPIITPPPPILPSNTVDVVSTPRRDLAPPIEEDEEPESESQEQGAPLRQIENNISALLRGDIPIARVTDIQPPRRPMGFRAGVHKSESAKEMLLSQTMFGPLPSPPRSPPSSSADEIDGFPPLPPLPTESNADVYDNKMWPDGYNYRSTSLGKNKYENRYRDSIESAPPVPPHRCPSAENTLKTMSMDSKYYKSMSPHTPGSTRSHDRMALSNSRKRMPGAYIKHTTPSPHEERRLQTSCSLPETPIFARGCDVPRTPHRRTQELPTCSGSRTAPRPMNSLNSSIVGIAGSTLNGRPGQRNINHALLSSEMLRIAGGPGRGWYPKQRQSRPVSNENLDRIQSGRAWDTNSASRKPLTLPPNLSPNFFKKSPTDALRRVTSLLIRKGTGTKETDKKEKVTNDAKAHRSFDSGTMEHRNTTQKKKGFFRSFWKKSKHYSIEQ